MVTSLAFPTNSKRLQFAVHSFRAKEEAVSKVILWQPSHGQKSRGRPPTTYVDLLMRDTGLRVEELATTMLDRGLWMSYSRDPRIAE